MTIIVVMYCGPGGSVPDDAPPAGAVQVILLLGVQPDVLLRVQLQPVQQALPVPPDRLQAHLVRLLLVHHSLELQVVIKLTLTQVLEGGLIHMNTHVVYMNTYEYTCSIHQYTCSVFIKILERERNTDVVYKPFCLSA